MGGSDDRGADLAADRKRQVSRLRRIEGQIRGLQEMVGSARPCADVSVQIDATVGALRRVQADLVRDHVGEVVSLLMSGDLPETERRRLADELRGIVLKLA